MQMRHVSDIFVLFDDAQANGSSKPPENIRDWMHIISSIFTKNNTTATIKFVGSQQDPNNPPDFSIPPSITNEWSYIGFTDMDSLASTAGSIGLVLAGVDFIGMLEMNTNGINWFGVEISGYAAGDIYIKGKGYSNH